MQFTCLLFVVAALEAVPALGDYTYKTQTQCKTQLGPNAVASAKTSSSSTSISETFTNKFTVTPVSTITVNQAGQTVTVSKTIGTTTTTTISNTISASAGFTPIVKGLDYAPKKRSLADMLAHVPAIKGRSPEKRADSPPIEVSNPAGASPVFSPAQYPTSVLCAVLIEAQSTVTQISSAAATTATVTRANNGPPPKYTTTTTTSTLTKTLIAPSPTNYAACSANNMITTANNGVAITGISSDTNSGVQLTTIPNLDATACCVACQTTDNCIGFALADKGACLVATRPGQCMASYAFGRYEAEAGRSGLGSWTVGNGNCGQLGNGEPQDGGLRV